MTTDYRQRFNLSLIGIVTLVTVEIGMIPASQAALLTGWRFNPATNQLEITLQDGTTPRYFLLAQPPRIVLDLPNTQLGRVATKRSYSGAVREIRVSQFQKDMTRVVLELSPLVGLAPEQVQLQRIAPMPGTSRLGERWLLRPEIAAQSIPVEMSTSESLPPSLPPAIETQQARVSVPSLDQVTANRGTPPPASTPPSAILPPATFGTQPGAIVSVPSLRSPVVSGDLPSPTTSASALQTTPQSVSRRSQPHNEQVIEFGQPLPKAPSESTVTPQNSLPTLQASPPDLLLESATNSTTEATSSSVVMPSQDNTPTRPTDSMLANSQGRSRTPEFLLPVGTQLSLRYAGDSILLLASGITQTEKLLLVADIRDRTGNLIAPAGTPVVGYFETEAKGSHFIAQAIALPNRNFPLAARSDTLNGNVQISGANALSAAPSNLPTSQSATLQPGQILQIRLTEPLR